jgi:hypothetical protein
MFVLIKPSLTTELCAARRAGGQETGYLARWTGLSLVSFGW